MPFIGTSIQPSQKKIMRFDLEKVLLTADISNTFSFLSHFWNTVLDANLHSGVSWGPELVFLLFSQSLIPEGAEQWLQKCLENRKEGRQGSCIPLGKTLHFGRIQGREFSVLNRLPVLSKASYVQISYVQIPLTTLQTLKIWGKKPQRQILQSTWAGSFKFTFSSSTGISKKLSPSLGATTVSHWQAPLLILPLAPRCFPAMGNLKPRDVLDVLQITPVKALLFSEEAKTSSTSLTPLCTLHQPHVDTCWNLAIIKPVWLNFRLSYLRSPWLLFLLSPKDLPTKIHRRAAGINLQLPLQKKEPRQVSRWQRRVFKGIAKFSEVSQQRGRRKIKLKVQSF